MANPHGAWLGDGYRMGDRVIIIRNDYQGARPVYNGQTGTLCSGEEGSLSVKLDDGSTVTVGRRDVELAYCLTVHKAQGSRYDRVVFICKNLDLIGQVVSEHILGDRQVSTLSRSIGPTATRMGGLRRSA